MSEENTITLPRPRFKSSVSIEETLRSRRSTRNFSKKPITLENISQLLWSAQGVTGAFNERTAPSAGGTFPLEVYVVAGNVTDLAPGVYKYHFRAHRLQRLIEGDVREELAAASLDQSCIKCCAAAFVLSAVYERTTKEYGERGTRYVHMELGHVGQNLHLQAVSLKLGAVAVGAFEDDAVARLLTVPKGEHPLYIIPVGKMR
jgi:SagB-type dehydrogenase family enzyme